MTVLAGCGRALAPGPTSSPPSPPPRPPIAEISDDGPDCLSNEVLAGLTGLLLEGSRPASSAGLVPSGFDTIAVVLCRSPGLTYIDEPPPPQILPRIDEPETTAPPTTPAADGPTPTRLTVEEVTLAGDLRPLLQALERPSDPVPDGVACPTIWIETPQIFLVDTDGRAVRPQWPATACGFLHDGAAETLDGLEEIESTTHVVEH